MFEISQKMSCINTEIYVFHTDVKILALLGLSHWGCDKISHFADNIFKYIFLNENLWISLEISLKSVPNVWINNILALVQIMAWCWLDDKPLSKPTMVCNWRIYAWLSLNELRSHYCFWYSPLVIHVSYSNSYWISYISCYMNRKSIMINPIVYRPSHRAQSSNANTKYHNGAAELMMSRTSAASNLTSNRQSASYFISLLSPIIIMTNI